MALMQYLQDIENMYIRNIRSGGDTISPIHIPEEIVQKISHATGLVFLSGEGKGNLCFANNNDELRDEFKQVFTSEDILNYCIAILHHPVYIEQRVAILKADFATTVYTQNATTFWQLVKPGSKLRHLFTLHHKNTIDEKQRLMDEIARVKIEN